MIITTYRTKITIAGTDYDVFAELEIDRDGDIEIPDWEATEVAPAGSSFRSCDRDQLRDAIRKALREAVEDDKSDILWNL